MNNKRLSLAEEAHLLDAQLATRRLFLKQCSIICWLLNEYVYENLLNFD